MPLKGVSVLYKPMELLAQALHIILWEPDYTSPLDLVKLASHGP